MKKEHDLYRFYDADDRLLYVGISLHAAQRASSHKRDKEWWPLVARMEVEHLGLVARSRAEEIEADAIRSEFPVHNVKHNSPKGDQIQWLCEICDEVAERGRLEIPHFEMERWSGEMSAWVDSFPEGSLVGEVGRVDWDALYAKPRRRHWWVICHSCDPSERDSSHSFDLTELTTLGSLLLLTSCLMGRPWLGETDWSRLLTVVSATNPVRTCDTLKRMSIQ